MREREDLRGDSPGEGFLLARGFPGSPEKNKKNLVLFGILGMAQRERSKVWVFSKKKEFEEVGLLAR